MQSEANLHIVATRQLLNEVCLNEATSVFVHCRRCFVSVSQFWAVALVSQIARQETPLSIWQPSLSQSVHSASFNSCFASWPIVACPDETLT